MKGLIVEKEKHYYIVLTPTGAYKKIKGSTEKAIGQEISVNTTFSIAKISLMAAALLVIVLLAQAILKMPGQQIFAYVTLDINPSVEFAIDKDYLVLQASSLNAEAKDLLSKIEYSGRRIDMVLADFTQAAILDRYIAEDKDNYIVVSFCPVVQDEATEVHLDEITGKQRQVIQSFGQEVEIDTLIINTDVKKRAKELGIPISKLKGNKNGQSENTGPIEEEAKPDTKGEKQNTRNGQKDLKQQEKTINKELKQEEKEAKKLEKQHKSNNSEDQDNKGPGSSKKNKQDGANKASDSGDQDDKHKQKNNGNKYNKQVKEDKKKTKRIKTE